MRPEVKPAVKQSAKSALKSAVKPAAKFAAKPSAQPSAKFAVKPVAKRVPKSPRGPAGNAAPRPDKGAGRGKSPRRRAREFVVQGLYSWQISKVNATDIEAVFATDKGFNNVGFDRANRELFSALLAGTIRESADLALLLQPALDRKFDELSPVERAVLLLAAYELKHAVEVPYRVIMNEAIELAKSYGGTDGHKYVNGVLNKLVRTLRPDEVAEKR